MPEEKKISRTYRFRPSTLNQLRMIAIEDRRNMSETMGMLIENEYLRRQKEERE